MDIALIGFGNVGQGFVSVLRKQGNELRKWHGFNPRIVAVATGSRGTLVDPNGLDMEILLSIADQRGTLMDYPDKPTLERDWNSERIARESHASVLVEASPTNLQTGQPALDLVRSALDYGKHVVLVNKGPVAVAYAELQAKAQSVGRLLRLEGTVMASTPAIRVGLQNLAGAGITSVRGIFNGTTNYMLGLMEAGSSYADALADAQAKGYAETDPSGDVDGWDSAGKVIILGAALFGTAWTLDDLDVSGISGLTGEEVLAAAAQGEHYKLIAELSSAGGSVQAVRVPASDPLAHVGGANNAITYRTDLLGDVTLTGAGAGREETGFAILSDLLEIHRHG